MAKKKTKKKKPQRKPAKSKRKATAKTAAGKKPVRKKKSLPKKKASKRTTAGKLGVNIPADLESRLNALAKSMGKSLEGLMVQALNEFADTWEDHQRVVSALNEEDDRVQLVVGKD